jgi:hypothetical protein
MHKHGMRRPILTGLLLTAAAAGPLSGGSDTGQHPAAKDSTIIVGPGPCDLTESGQPCKTQTISKKKLHKIVWKSNAGQILGIVVHVPRNCNEPFKQMTQVGTDAQGNVRWAIKCKDGQCKSGPAETGACEQSYLYDQILDDKTCDGMIIIDK